MLSILQTCSRVRYELVSDFGWYVSVLADIARIPHSDHGDEVGRQLVDIALRVESVRTDVVRASRGLLVDPALLGRPALRGVLCAAAWIVGEYIERAPLGPYEILEALLQPRTRLLPFFVHAVYLQGVLKVFVSYAHSQSLGKSKETPEQDEYVMAPGGGGSLHAAVELIKANVAPLASSVDMEVQERACNVLGLIQPFEDPSNAGRMKEGLETLNALSEVLSLELGPVSVHAQGRVSLPDGLLIEDSLDALGPVDSSDDMLLNSGMARSSTTYREWEAEFSFQPPSKENSSAVDSSAALLQQHRHRHESYYLPSDAVPSEDYPPAAAAASTEAASHAPSDSSTFIDSSLLRAKPRQGKARRPVVVALDDEDDLPGVSAPVSKKGLKDELVFSAIRDALSADGNKGHDAADGGLESPLVASSSRKSRHSQRSVKNREKSSPREIDEVGSYTGDALGNETGKRTSDVGHREHRRSRHRPSKHEILVLPNNDGSSSENDKECTFQLSEKTHRKKHKHRSSHRHNRRQGKSPVSTPQNSGPIPDFLL